MRSLVLVLIQSPSTVRNTDKRIFTSNCTRTLDRHYHEANASSHGRPKHDGRGVFVGWRSPVDSSAGRFRGGQLVTAAAGNLTHTVRLAERLNTAHHYYPCLHLLQHSTLCAISSELKPQ